ncbi:MAG: ABC transporter ATP-binding protein [Planctomycetota bacterium]|nr:MAG: ABC transporter ATP-binding protein [Planctomycetota bacterium]
MTDNGDILVEHLCKDYILQYNRAMTLKSRFVGIFNRRYRTTKTIFRALDDINFRIPNGISLGVMGHNGSGKSTLLKLLAGILIPTSGKIKVPDDAYIGTMIQLGVGFSPELTGLENVYLSASLYGYQRKEIDKKVEEIIEFAELSSFIDVPVKNYSSGMQARLGFSVMIIMDMDILLIDEVFAAGDLSFQEKSKAKMMEFKEANKTIVFVSHSAKALDEFCDYVCLLYKGKMVGIGVPKDVNEQYVALTHKRTTFEEAQTSLAVPEALLV